MAVLSRGIILDRMRLPINDPSGLVITPLLDAQSAFDEDAVDLRLGTHFLLPRVPPEPFFYPDSKPRTPGNLRVHVPLGNYLVVPAHQTVLGATLEFIKLPFDVSGQILTKSSIARTFMAIETAPWIHPFYRGCLTLEIANVSNTPLLLYPGRHIGQLVLMHVDEARIPDKLSGTYVGAVYPEPAAFKGLKAELGVVGARAIRKWLLAERPCPSCRDENSADANYCSTCGIKL